MAGPPLELVLLALVGVQPATMHSAKRRPMTISRLS
jgi:hypothetical protein